MNPDPKRIDTHQHFWRYNAREYDWMGPGKEKLRRDHLPEDLAPLLKSAGVDGTVAVQARQTVEESYWLLELAASHPFIFGVVGWVDLRCPRVDEDLEKLSRHPKFRSVRHVVQDEPDDQFLLREDVQRGIGRLAKFGLKYDLLLYPRQLPAAVKLVERFHDQPFILDHISKPLIKEKKIEPWATDIRRLAAMPNVACKVSGMVTEADWKNWKPADFTPYLDIVFECFGTKRLMVGSDWPVCTLAGDYPSVMKIAGDYISKLSRDEQEAVWGGNARRWYGV
jgi:L-fuconolactonase